MLLIANWSLTIKMEDLSLHILDIAENSINAGAKNIEIAIIEISEKDLLTVEIKDDGKGWMHKLYKRSKIRFTQHEQHEKSVWVYRC
jgi:DNA polymerase III epsilon subunit-like protein